MFLNSVSVFMAMERLMARSLDKDGRSYGRIVARLSLVIALLPKGICCGNL